MGKSFTPAEVAKNVPKIRALLLMKRLLLEVQANLDNRKEFRKLLRQLAQDKGSVTQLLGELKGFEDFKVPGGVKDERTRPRPRPTRRPEARRKKKKS